MKKFGQMVYKNKEWSYIEFNKLTSENIIMNRCKIQSRKIIEFRTVEHEYFLAWIGAERKQFDTLKESVKWIESNA